MEPVIAAVATISGLGLLFGLGLALGGRIFAVQSDPRLDRIAELLPQLNCGACGYGGCLDCARAMLDEKAAPSACPVCPPAARRQIAELLGRLLEEEARTVARVFCRGGYDAARRYLYEGIKKCEAANQIGGGVIACDYGCLRYYTCRRACPFEAIEVDPRGNPVVIADRCRSCGLCVRHCPRQIIRLVPADSKFDILCSSRAKGKEVIRVCASGCVACAKCVKECPEQAISIEENLARIDYEKCVNCGKCVEACPRGTIVEVEGEKCKVKSVRCEV